MITTKKDLKRIIKSESEFYLQQYGKNKKDKIMRILTKEPMYYLYKYNCYLRKAAYYLNTNKKLRYLIYKRKKNKYGVMLGIEIGENCFDENLIIHHAGNIVVNPNARIGKNCQLHGSNCIGNNGKEGNPLIGDNVDIGVGAKIIGKITIANNVKIGAGAVVTKDCLEEGAIYVGIPAKIKNKE